MILREAAQSVRAAGQGGDNILAHINSEEARHLARKFGGDVNPHTGLPQFGFFKKVKKTVKKVGKSVGKVASKAAPIVGAFNPVLGAALGAGGALARGKGLSSAIKGGIGGGLGGLALGGAGSLLAGAMGGGTAAAGASPGWASMLSGAFGGAPNGGGNGGDNGGGFGWTDALMNGLGGGSGNSAPSGGGSFWDNLISGGGRDGTGNWGALGDFLGGAPGGATLGSTFNGGAPGAPGAAGGQQGSPLAGGLGALLGGALGYASSDDLKTKQTQDLPAWQKPYVQQALAGAQSLYQNNPNTVAPLSSQTMAGINGITSPGAADPYKQVQQYLQGSLSDPAHASDLSGVANEFKGLNAAQGHAYTDGYDAQAAKAQGLGNGASGSYYKDVIGGKYLGGNPYLDGVIKKAQGDVQSRVDSQFASGGRLNSGASARALAGELGDLSNTMRYTDYNNERGRMGDAASGLAGLDQFGINASNDLWSQLAGRMDSMSQFNTGQQNAMTQYGMGQYGDLMQNQAGRDDAMAQFNKNYGLQATQGISNAQDDVLKTYASQMAAGNVLDQHNQSVADSPYTNLQRYLQSVGGGFGSTSTSTQPQNQTLNTLAGATGGYSLGSSLFSPQGSSMFAPH